MHVNIKFNQWIGLFIRTTIFKHYQHSHSIPSKKVFRWNSIIMISNLWNKLFRVKNGMPLKSRNHFTCCCQSGSIIWCPITIDQCPATHDSNSACYAQPNLYLTIRREGKIWMIIFTSPLIIGWPRNGIILIVNNHNSKIIESYFCTLYYSKKA